MTDPEPPDPPSTPPHDPVDEIEVDLDDELPEGAEYLGSYASIAAYLRAMLEPEVSPGCAWVLDHLDYAAVRRRCERDGWRLLLERGQVYRVAARESEDKPPRG